MAEYFVSPTGSDSSGNGTLGAPWKTIARGVSALNAGDTLYLRGGTYTERNTVAVSKNNCVISAYQNEKPIWDVQKAYPPDQGGGIPYTALLDLAGTSVTASGIEFRNSRGRAVFVPGNNCVVRGCRVVWTGRHGIHVEGNDCTLEECAVIDSSQLSGTGGQIQFRYCSGATLSRCTVTGGRGEGVIFLQSRNAKALNNTVYNVQLAHIYFDNCDTGLCDSNSVFYSSDSNFDQTELIRISQEYYENQVPTKDITVINNIAVGGNPCLNISVGSDRLGPGGPIVPVPNAGFKNLKIANNTFINGVVRATVRIYDQPETNTAEHTPCWMVNNVIVQDSTSVDLIQYRTASTIAKWTFGNNLYNRQPDAGVRGQNDVVGPPQLVNYQQPLRRFADFVARNYCLTESSPGIDAGSSNYPVTVTRDHFGQLRDSRLDIGMHEFVTEGVRADFTASPTTGTAPLTVQFTDRSTPADAITSRFWDFGDGAVSTERNPSHKYNQGQFTVSLRVTTPSGSDITTKNVLISVNVPESAPSARVTEGLSALYRFDEGTGDTIFDVSGAGKPSDLIIRDVSTVRWLGPGLEITKPAIIFSNGPATKINEACRNSNEITVEAWITPSNTTQDGPARIVSISKNLHSRNVTLGQGLWGTQPPDLFDVRLRTTERSANGMPSFFTPAGTAKKELTHVAFTRFRNGRARLIVNGVIVAETVIPGDFSTWNPRFPLLLANESTGEYPWLGAIYLIAIYERGLSHTEVKQNFNAGVPTISQAAEQTPVTLTSFRRFVLVKSENGFVVNGKAKTVAFGVQYPDMRCVLCANGKSSNMIIFKDVNSIIYAYGKQGLKLSWLD